MEYYVTSHGKLARKGWSAFILLPYIVKYVLLRMGVIMCCDVVLNGGALVSVITLLPYIVNYALLHVYFSCRKTNK